MKREELSGFVEQLGWGTPILVLYDKYEEIVFSKSSFNVFSSNMVNRENFTAETVDLLKELHKQFRDNIGYPDVESPLLFVRIKEFYINRLKYFIASCNGMSKKSEENKEYRDSTNWRKVIKGYLDVTRNFISVLSMLKGMRAKEDKKTILVVASMPRGDACEALANKEVDNILSIVYPSKDYTVLVKYYCTYKDMQYALSLRDYCAIHYAGHSDEDGLNFMLQGKKFSKDFFKDIGIGYEFVFLNSCLSYFCFTKKSKDIVGIGYKRYLSGERAYDASAVFYNDLVKGKDVDDCFSDMKSSQGGRHRQRRNRHYRIVK